MLNAWRFGLRRFRRSWHSGENLVLMLALAIAVAATGAVALFSDRVERAIGLQSGEAMGADLLVTGRREIPADYRAAVTAAGAQTTLAVNLPTVVFAGEASTLAAVKAVDTGYPLRGVLRTTHEPFADEIAARDIPAPGEAWADLRLWTELDLKVGDALTVGAATLTVARLLTYEPDRGSGFVDLAPRLLINAADLPATQLVQPGSRTEYRLLIAGDETVIATVREIAVPHALRRLGPDEARGEIRETLKRSGRFLDLAVLAAMLLAGSAVALASQRHGARLRDEAALMKCLGAQQNVIRNGLIAGLLLLGLIAGSAGVAVGALAQWALSALLAGLMQNPLPAASPWPLLGAFGLGLAMLLGFGLPPLLQAGRVPPIRVFQRDATVPASRWDLAAALATGAGLLMLQTGDLKLSVSVLGGAAAALALLAGIALLLMRALAPLRKNSGRAWQSRHGAASEASVGAGAIEDTPQPHFKVNTVTSWAWRLGLSNLARRRWSTVSLASALGLCLLALLLLTVSRNDLLNAWRDQLKPDTPNVFLVGIQPAQLTPLQAFFDQRGIVTPPPFPMVRARLTALNGVAVTADSFDDPETQRWINRDFNLSWTEELGDDNKLLEGTWWGENGRGQPWLSVDDYAVQRLKLKLGDTLTLQIADAAIVLTVKSVREIHWDSFRPNFFLVTPPGVLDRAPASWLASFHLPKSQRAVLRELVREFPNVTALDLDALMTQVRQILERIVRAVEFILLFALAAGLAVLLAAIENTRDERRREIGLLRTLGARRATVMQALTAEFAALGLLAGAVAALAAQGTSFALARFVFEIPYSLNPTLWLIGPIAGVILTTGFGAISLWSTLNTPPKQVLAAGP